MFNQDQKKIQAYAQSGPEQFAHVTTFVLISIRNPIELTPRFMSHVKEHGASSKYLWGIKRKGYLYVHANSERILEEALACKTHWQLLLCLAQIPGLGLPKAGFLAQLAFGKIGCLDVHNLRRYGLEASIFKIHNKDRAKLYCHLCRNAGGPKLLWDEWCRYVHALRPGKIPSADYVSKLHCIALELEQDPYKPLSLELN